MAEEKEELIPDVGLLPEVPEGKITLNDIDLSGLEPVKYDHEGIGVGEAALRQFGAGAVDVPLGVTSTVDYLGQLLGISDKAQGSMSEALINVQNRILGSNANIEDLLARESKGMTLTIEELKALDDYIPREMRAEFQSEDFSERLFGFVGLSDKVSPEEAWTWFALNNARIAPQAAAMMVGSLGVAKYGQALAKGAQGTAAFGSAMKKANWAAAGTAGVYSGFLEGGSAYREMIENGEDPKEAAKKASQIALGSVAITTAMTGIPLFVLAGQKGKLYTAGRVAVSEPVEEPSQQAWSNLVQGKPIGEGLADAALLSIAFGVGDVFVADKFGYKDIIEEMKRVESAHGQALLDNERLEVEGYVTPKVFRKAVEDAAGRIEKDVAEQAEYLKYTIDQFAENPEIPLNEDQRQLLEDLAITSLAHNLQREGFLKTRLPQKTLDALGEINFYAKSKLAPQGGIAPDLYATISNTQAGSGEPTGVMDIIPVESQDDLGADKQELSVDEEGTVTSGPAQDDRLQADPRSLFAGYAWNDDKRRTVQPSNKKLQEDLQTRLGDNYISTINSMVTARGLSLPKNPSMRQKVTALKKFDEGVEKLQNSWGKTLQEVNVQTPGTIELNYMNQVDLQGVARDMGISSDDTRISTGKNSDKMLNMRGRVAIQKRLGRLADSGYPQVTIDGMTEQEVLAQLDRESMDAEQKKEADRQAAQQEANRRANPQYLGGEQGAIAEVMTEEELAAEDEAVGATPTAGAGGRLQTAAATTSQKKAVQDTGEKTAKQKISEMQAKLQGKQAPAETAQTEPKPKQAQAQAATQEEAPANQETEAPAKPVSTPAWVSDTGEIDRRNSNLKRRISIINNTKVGDKGAEGNPNPVTTIIKGWREVIRQRDPNAKVAKNIKLESAKRGLVVALNNGEIDITFTQDGVITGVKWIGDDVQSARSGVKRKPLIKGGSPATGTPDLRVLLPNRGQGNITPEQNRVHEKARNAITYTEDEWVDAHSSSKRGLKVSPQAMRDYAKDLGLNYDTLLGQVRGNQGQKNAGARRVVAKKLYQKRNEILRGLYSQAYKGNPSQAWMNSPDMKDLFARIAERINQNKISQMPYKQKAQIARALGVATREKAVGSSESSRLYQQVEETELDRRLNRAISGLKDKSEAPLQQYDDPNLDPSTARPPQQEPPQDSDVQDRIEAMRAGLDEEVPPGPVEDIPPPVDEDEFGGAVSDEEADEGLQQRIASAKLSTKKPQTTGEISSDTGKKDAAEAMQTVREQYDALTQQERDSLLEDEEKALADAIREKANALGALYDVNEDSLSDPAVRAQVIAEANDITKEGDELLETFEQIVNGEEAQSGTNTTRYIALKSTFNRFGGMLNMNRALFDALDAVKPEEIVLPGDSVAVVKKKKVEQKEAPASQASNSAEAKGKLADAYDWEAFDDMKEFAEGIGIKVLATHRRNQVRNMIDRRLGKIERAREELELSEDIGKLYDAEKIEDDWGDVLRGATPDNLHQKMREWHHAMNARLIELASKKPVSESAKQALDYSVPLKNDRQEQLAQEINGYATKGKGLGGDGTQIWVYTSNGEIVGFRSEGKDLYAQNGLQSLINLEYPEAQENMEFEYELADGTIASLTADEVHRYNGMRIFYPYQSMIGSKLSDSLVQLREAKAESWVGIESARRMVAEAWQEIDNMDRQGIDAFDIANMVRGDDEGRSDVDGRNKFWDYVTNMAIQNGMGTHPISGETLSSLLPEWTTASEGAKADIMGREFKNEDELALALQAFRNPYVEIGSIVMMKDGKVFDVVQGTNFQINEVITPFVWWDADTSALVNAAENAFNSGSPATANEMLANSIALGRKRAFEYMKANGVDGFYVSHNHPSGDAKPSTGDEKIHKIEKDLFGDLFLGDIILDSNNYTFMTTDQNGNVMSNNRLIWSAASQDFRTGQNPFDQPLTTPYLEEQAVTILQDMTEGKASGLYDDDVATTMADARYIAVSNALASDLGETLTDKDLAAYSVFDSVAVDSSDFESGEFTRGKESINAIAHTLRHMTRGGSDLILVARTAGGKVNAIHRVDVARSSSLTSDDLVVQVEAFKLRQGSLFLSAYTNGNDANSLANQLSKKMMRMGLLYNRTEIYTDGTQLSVKTQEEKNHNSTLMSAMSRMDVATNEDNMVIGEPASGNLAKAPISEEAKRRLEDASVGDPNTLKDSIAATWRRVTEGFTTEFKGLPRIDKKGRFNFEEARASLRKIVTSRSSSSYKAMKELTKLTNGMSKSQIKDASYYMIFKDLKGQADLNAIPYKDVDGKQVTAFGLSAKEIQDGYSYYESLVERDPRLKKMIEDRVKLISDIRNSFAKKWGELGLPVDNKFNDEWFWRRQVIEYSEMRAEADYKGAITTPSKMGMLKRRRGYLKDYVTNYFVAEGELLHTLMMGERSAEALLHIRDKYALSYGDQRELAKQARKDNVEFDQVVPEGYSFYQPEKGNMYFMARSMSDNQLLKFMQDIGNGLFPNFEDVGSDVVGLGGRKQGMVIPTEIANALRNIDKRQEIGAFRFYRRFVSAAKMNMLLNPFRIIKYNLRNITGDADAVFIGNRKLFTSKQGRESIKKAMRELWDVYYNGAEMSPELEAYMERGGFDNVLTAQEFESGSALTKELEELGQFMAPDEDASVAKKAARGFKSGFIKYFSQAQKASDFRETILRYANFLDYKRQMENNNGLPENFGASDPRRVQGLASIDDRAYRLSDDLMGAYDEVSDYGQWVRRNVAWFWSWQETNARRFYQMLKNDVDPNPSDTMTIGELAFRSLRSPVAWYGASKFVTRAIALSAGLMFFNSKFFGDEMDDVDEHVAGRPALYSPIRGKNGEVIYFTRIGAVSDVAEWVGLDDVVIDLRDVMNGKRSIGQVVQDNFGEGVNKAVQSLRPDVKTFVEAITGTSYFPDFFSPRSIRDPKSYAAQTLGLEMPFGIGSDLGSKIAPSLIDPRNYDTSNSFIKSFAYVKDPKEASYHRVFDMSQKYLKDRGLEREMLSWSPKTNALYSMKRAVKMGDNEGVKLFLERYLYHDSGVMTGSLSGIKSSMERMAPLASMSAEHRRNLIRSMSPTERRHLERAEQYYAETLVGNGLIEEILASHADSFAGRAPAEDIRLLVQQTLSDALIDQGMGKYDDANRRVRSVMQIIKSLPRGKGDAVVKSLSPAGIRSSARRKVKRQSLETAVLNIPDDNMASALSTLFGL